MRQEAKHSHPGRVDLLHSAVTGPCDLVSPPLHFFGQVNAKHNLGTTDDQSNPNLTLDSTLFYKH